MKEQLAAVKLQYYRGLFNLKEEPDKELEAVQKQFEEDHGELVKPITLWSQDSPKGWKLKTSRQEECSKKPS